MGSRLSSSTTIFPKQNCPALLIFSSSYKFFNCITTLNISFLLICDIYIRHIQISLFLSTRFHSPLILSKFFNYHIRQCYRPKSWNVSLTNFEFECDDYCEFLAQALVSIIWWHNVCCEFKKLLSVSMLCITAQVIK